MDDSDLGKIVPDPKPCDFCVCAQNEKAKISTSFSVCGCPCHWQNIFGLKERLEAVEFFFGDKLKKAKE